MASFVLLMLLLMISESTALDTAQESSGADSDQPYVYDRMTGEFWFVPHSPEGVESLLEISEEERNKNSEKAAYAAYQALNLADSLNYDEGLARAYFFLGELYEMYMDYAQALKEYQAALQVERSLQRENRISKLLNEISMIHIQQGEFGIAIDHLERSIELLEDTNYELILAEAISALGLAHYHLKNYEMSLEYFDQVQNMAGSSENLDKIKMISVLNEANTYVQLYQFDRAESLLLQAIRYFGEHGYVADQSKSYFDLARLYHRWDKPGEALTVAFESMELAESIEENSLIRNGYLLLSIIYEEQGNSQQALLNHQRYHTLYTQAHDNEREARLTQRQIQHAVAQRNREIRQLNQETALQEAELAKRELRQNLLYGGLGFSIIIAGLLFRNIYYKKSANQRLQQKQSKIEASLKEKEILLSEIHHRVKNNLAIISSLLHLQAQTSTDNEVKAILSESEGRVQSMALIHELLYEHTDFSKIEFGVYINKLLRHVSANYETPGVDITTEVKSDPVFIEITKAVPCALICHELITNSYKHAFKGRAKGKITITLSLSNNNTITLIISDDGRGFQPHTERSTLGLSLIHGLAKQINGTLTSETENGTTFTITFPADNHSQSKSGAHSALNG